MPKKRRKSASVSVGQPGKRPANPAEKIIDLKEAMRIIKNLRSQVAEKDRLLAAKTLQINRQHARALALSVKYIDYQKEVATKFNDMKRSLEQKLTKAAQDAAAKNKELQTIINTLQTQNDGQQLRIRALENQIAPLHQQKSDDDAKIRLLNQSLDKALKSVRDEKKKLKLAREELEKINATRRDASVKAQQIEQLNAQIAALKLKAEQDLADQKDSLATAHKSALQTSLAELTTKLENTEGHLEASKRGAEKAKLELNGKSKEIEQLKAQIAALKLKAEQDLADQKASLNDAFELKLQQTIANLKETFAREIEGLKSKNDSLVKQILELKEKVNRLENKSYWDGDTDSNDLVYGGMFSRV